VSPNLSILNMEVMRMSRPIGSHNLCNSAPLSEELKFKLSKDQLDAVYALGRKHRQTISEIIRGAIRSGWKRRRSNDEQPLSLLLMPNRPPLDQTGECLAH
jgi:hypothetical protein